MTPYYEQDGITIRRGHRQYRETIIPKKARLAEVQADAERAARDDAA